MKANKELSGLQSQRNAIQEKIDEIELRQRIEENEVKVGKCFAYDNGYDHENRWPMYTKVLSLNDSGWFKTFSFQITSDGKYESHIEEYAYGSGLEKEISEDGFWLAWLDYKNKLLDMVKKVKS